MTLKLKSIIIKGRRLSFLPDLYFNEKAFSKYERKNIFMKTPKVVLAGIGGYGELYLNRLFKLSDEDRVEVVGLVDPFPSPKHMDEINSRGWKIYPSLEDFYKENRAELACISTPIGFHTRMILTALENGSNVICEKPLTGDVTDLEKLTAAREKYGKFMMVGYQWSYSDAVLNMKRDILAGLYGKPEFLKTLVLWPRNKAYFNRGTGWAGRIRSSDGTLILDSVANNAAAHYLHNIFFTLGDSLDSAETPIKTTAELYRANPIENFDTAIIRCEFSSGANSLYIASHSTEKTQNPLFEYRFEKGVITYEERAEIKHIIGRLADGTVKDYGDPFADDMKKLEYAVENVVSDKAFIPCGIETASAQVRCIAECAKQPIVDFPEERKRTAPGELTYIDGLYEELVELFNKN